MEEIRRINQHLSQPNLSSVHSYLLDHVVIFFMYVIKSEMKSWLIRVLFIRVFLRRPAWSLLPATQAIALAQTSHHEADKSFGASYALFKNLKHLNSLLGVSFTRFSARRLNLTACQYLDQSMSTAYF